MIGKCCVIKEWLFISSFVIPSRRMPVFPRVAIFFIFLIFFFFYVYDVLPVCLCTTCVLGAPRGQMSGSLEGQLIDVYEPPCGCGESNPGPPEE